MPQTYPTFAVSLALVITALGAAPAGAKEGPVIMLGKRHAVERLLGTELPSQVRNLEYFRAQPSRELSYYTAYVKFETSREGFLDLVRRTGMDLAPSGAGALRHLPAAWSSAGEVGLAWWDPAPGTPADAAAKSTDYGGWIVAKHENGNIYLIKSETGISGGSETEK